MPISYNKELTFVHIPKCAGSTIEKIIGGTGEEQLYSQKRVSELFSEFNIDKTPQHLTAFELLLIKKDLPEMFSIVRNPFDRLVSEYFYVLNEINFDKDLRLNHAKLGFDRFVRWGLSLNNKLRILLFDGHLEKQVDFLIHPETKEFLVKNIFEFEDIDKCFLFLKERLKYEFEVQNAKKTNHLHYSIYYDENLCNYVQEFYKEDLKTFNYKFEKKY